MEKVSFKFVGYILFKWLCFYAYQLTLSHVNWKTPNLEGFFLATFMVLAWPILEIIVLWIPFHLAFKQKGITQILILLSAFILEFVLGWYITNQKFETWMLMKLFLSVGIFTLIYRKQVRLFAI
jgi:hypothetical protein